MKSSFGFIFALLISIPTWIMSCFNPSKVTAQSSSNTNKSSTMLTSFHSLSADALDGKTITMDQYKGKKVIVLNVASKCGYTPQYADWQAFYEKNKENFVVLGFPCNQFMGQEPGTAEDIESFCQKNYGVTFQMFDKVDVKGADQHPVYKWLTTPEQNGWNADVPSWNFCKYLIDENGNLTHFFASKIKPDSPEFLAAIK
ncbi:MAG: glutathione peroxidase [Saprospiraceae bacterium]|nr:glutathione peroxidase [Saprospiraceae bacterium]